MNKKKRHTIGAYLRLSKKHLADLKTIARSAYSLRKGLDEPQPIGDYFELVALLTLPGMIASPVI